MSIIEGIGDEVAVFGVILLVLILAATFTFVLNNNPVSERHLSPPTATTNVVTSSQNHENHTADDLESPRSSSTEANSDDRDSVSDSISLAALAEQEPDDQNSEALPDSTCHNSGNINSTPNSNIYPEVPQDSNSRDRNASAEPDAQDEDSSPDSGLNRIRLKYLNDTERSVRSLLTTTVAEFKRTHFAEDLASNKVVRLIYAGQRLQDHATLQSYGIGENCVVHVQIVEAQVPHPSSSSQNAELDLSHLLWPLLSVILGICWILYFKYPEFFNLMSLGILLLFTGSFVYFYSQVQLQR